MALLFQNACSEMWHLYNLEAILDSIEDEISEAIQKKQLKTGNDYYNLVLHSAGKSIVTMREISTLVACGYPDGALSLSRNLYEQLVILAFFDGKYGHADFDKYVEDFFTDYDIQRYQALIYECKNCCDNAEKLTTLKDLLATAKEKRHSKGQGTYWWAGCSTFSNFVNSVIASQQSKDAQHFLHVLHLHYKRACASLHASCMGNALRLGGTPGFVGIDTTQTEKGHGMPLWFATSSINYVLSVAFAVLELEYQNHETALSNLSSFYREKEFEL